MASMTEIKAGVTNKLVDGIFEHFKNKNNLKYHEDTHCKLLIKIMLDYQAGTVPAFCTEAMITDATFYNWVNTHELFRNLYLFCKLAARELWEEEGRRIRDREYMIGIQNYEFEYWKMIGWSRFGVSKNARLKINLKPGDSPTNHYYSILQQAGEGEFTASEFKQLMEAVNVGLNVVQSIDQQKQIDELKADLATMQANANGQNTVTNKGTAQNH